MASKQKTYSNIDEILDFVLNESDPESDADIDLGGGISGEELESDWEYETEPNIPVQSETVPSNAMIAENTNQV